MSIFSCDGVSKIGLLSGVVLGLSASSLAFASGDHGAGSENSAPVASQDYVAESDLKVATTNQPISSEDSNRLSLHGVGTESTYKFRYNFNSGSFDTFELLNILST